MPASQRLHFEPMRSCPKLGNNTPEMLAALADVRLVAVSYFDVPAHLSLAGGRSMLHVGSMTAAQASPLFLSLSAFWCCCKKCMKLIMSDQFGRPR